MNADYKILAYILTAWLCDQLTFLVSPNQTAYMKGHFIGTNIKSVQDMINYTAKNNLDHLVLFLDFKKAFDSVLHRFLMKLEEGWFAWSIHQMDWGNILRCHLYC